MLSDVVQEEEDDGEEEKRKKEEKEKEGLGRGGAGVWAGETEGGREGRGIFFCQQPVVLPGTSAHKLCGATRIRVVLTCATVLVDTVTL